MASVLLCSDEPVLFEGLKKTVSGVNGLELLPRCADLHQLRSELAVFRPDIVVIDLCQRVTLHELNEYRAESAKSKVVLWGRSISTELALQAMGVGIRGILRKTSPVDILLSCLLKVSEGECWFERDLTESLGSTRRYTLTPRESELVSLLSQGLKNKEIARALAISEGTVKVYLSRLFQKLGVKDRFELAIFGLKNMNSVRAVLDGAERASHKTRPAAKKAPLSFFVERRFRPHVDPHAGLETSSITPSV